MSARTPSQLGFSRIGRLSPSAARNNWPVVDRDRPGRRSADPAVLMRLRKEVAAGTYMPPVEALVESIVGQLVDRVDWPPAQRY